MEEIIKQIIDKCKKCEFVACEQCEISWTQVQEIEKLYNSYKKLEKEVEKLTSARNWYFEHYTSEACTPEMLHKILRLDYIPKSVIEEKIKEIDDSDLEIYETDSEDVKIAKYEGRAILDVLQELLEKGNS